MCWEHILAYSWAKSSNTKSTVTYRTQYLKWKAEWMYQLFILVISWLTRSYCSLLLPSILGVSEGISLGQEKIQNSTHSLYWNVSPNIYIWFLWKWIYTHIYSLTLWSGQIQDFFLSTETGTGDALQGRVGWFQNFAFRRPHCHCAWIIIYAEYI